MNQEQSPVLQNKEPKDEGKIKSLTLTHSESFSGPIPPPTILEGYERIHAGLADRIMKMAESQSEHRKILERNAWINKFKKRRYLYHKHCEISPTKQSRSST